MEKTAPQERVRQFFLVVAGDDDYRTVNRFDEFFGFVNIKLHAIEFLQQIIGKLDVRLVDFVDQQNGLHIRFEGFPDFAAHNVVGYVVHAIVAELGITQSSDRVVIVQSLLRLGR